MRRQIVSLFMAVSLMLTLNAALPVAVPQEPAAQVPAAAAAQGTESGEIASVEGKVFDSSSGQPVEGARVGLLRMDRGMTAMAPLWDEAEERDPAAQRQKTLTGTSGIFRFRVAAPAAFQLFIEHEGYTDGQAGNFSSLRVEPSQTMDDIVIQLQPEGYIRGRVIDIDSRQPLAGFRVLAHGYRQIGGERGPFAVIGASETTDEDGRYSVEGLPPGECYLEVRLPLRTSFSAPTPVEDFLHAEQFAYASYWYPGAESVEQSVPVSLTGGGSLEDIEFPIARRRVTSIRGRVLGEESTDEVQLTLSQVRIGVMSRGSGPVVFGSWRMNSEFQIDGLLPGTYQLNATATTDDLVETRHGALRFELGEQNRDGLDFVLLSGVNVRGEVRIDGQEARPGQPVLPADGFSVFLRPPEGGGGGTQPFPAPINSEDGTLVFNSVTPRDYLVTLNRLPRGYRISEVRYNGSVARHGLVSINPAANEHRIEIVLAPATGTLAASVTDGIRPVSGAIVRILPGDLDEHTDFELLRYLVASGRTDDSGHATIGPLLPGVYRATAIPAGSEWRDDPDLAHRLVNGEEVTVLEIGTTLLQLRVEE